MRKKYIIGLIVLFISSCFNFYVNKFWPVLSMYGLEFPLTIESATGVANRHVEGLFNSTFSRSSDDSPWDPERVVEREKRFLVEFRHRGNYCEKLTFIVDKKTGFIEGEQEGKYYDLNGCKDN